MCGCNQSAQWGSSADVVQNGGVNVGGGDVNVGSKCGRCNSGGGDVSDVAVTGVVVQMQVHVRMRVRVQMRVQRGVVSP